MATNKLITVQQLDSAVDGFASAVAAAGYEKKANLKALAYVDEIADTHLASSITTVLAAKMTTARAQELVDKNVGKAYKPGGNATLATLPAADAAHFGYVYNMTEEFTTTDNFIEGAGKIFTAGSEVAIVEVEGSDPMVYKYNVLSGYIDTTKFAAQSSFATVKAAVENLSIATNSDIQALIDGLSLEEDVTYSGTLNEVTFGGDGTGGQWTINTVWIGENKPSIRLYEGDTIRAMLSANNNPTGYNTGYEITLITKPEESNCDCYFEVDAENKTINATVVPRS